MRLKKRRWWKASGEWRWVAIASIVALGLSSLPFTVGWLASTPDLTFGGAVVDIADFNSYLAKMRQGARGEWRYRLLFTPEPHDGIPLPTFYVALGHVARSTGLPVVTLYHLSRLVSGLLMLSSIYAFIALFFRRRVLRRISFLLAVFGSGFGWVVLLAGPPKPGVIWPIDFWLIDVYPFFALLTFPHFCAATAAMLGVFGGVLSYLRNPRTRLILLIVICSIGLAIIHPHAAAVVDTVLLAYGALLWWKRKGFPSEAVLPFGVAGLLPLPIVIYIHFATELDPVFRSFREQNLQLSPPPGHYLLGYGLVFLLAIPGLIRAVGRRDERLLFLGVWLTAVAGLAYSPIPLQRRTTEGLFIGLSILAVHGLAEWFLPAVRRSWLAGLMKHRFQYPPHRLSRFTLNLVLALAAVSNIYLVTAHTMSVARRDPRLFYSRAQTEAFEWLAANTGPEETVLAGQTAGSRIPAATGNRVFVGHAAFFSGEMPDETASRLLNDFGVRYVYWGTEEKALGRLDMADRPFLIQRYERGDIALFEVATD
jgi:hypothetical protein